MAENRIRPLALCLFRRGDDILVFEGVDTVKPEVFYRPLGGGIHFGERAEDAARREIREEIGAETTNLRLLGVLENLFTHQGAPGHEVVFLFQGDFVDPKFYEMESMTGHEDGGVPFTAVWKPLTAFVPGKAPLYPDELLGLLRPHNAG